MWYGRRTRKGAPNVVEENRESHSFTITIPSYVVKVMGIGRGGLSHDQIQGAQKERKDRRRGYLFYRGQGLMIGDPKHLY